MNHRIPGPFAEVATSAVAGGYAIVAALDANALQAWAAAGIAIALALCGFLRETRRRNFEQDRNERLSQAIDQANIDAIIAKQPPPFPQFLPPPTPRQGA